MKRVSYIHLVLIVLYILSNTNNDISFIYITKHMYLQSVLAILTFWFEIFQKYR